MIRCWLLCLGIAAFAGCSVLPGTQQPPVFASDPATRAADMGRLILVTVRNPPSPGAPRAGSTMRNYDPLSEYSVSPAARNSSRAIARRHKLREISSWPIPPLDIHCLVFEVPADTSRGAMLEILSHDQRVESVQPLQSFETSTTGYNDPYQPLQNNLSTLGISQAHRWARGAGVSIAIIDTAVDAAHPDLAGRIARQESFLGTLDNVPADAPVRLHHGTAVAGVIAAVANNGVGIVGVAPAVRLVALNACWSTQVDSTHAVCNTFTLAKALVAAIEARVDIVNLSLSGRNDPLLARLVKAAVQQGIVVVGANPYGLKASGFPAGIDGVISVASMGAARRHDAEGAEPTLLAPGTDILTLVPQGYYDYQSGSSLATASISGGIALLLERDRKLTAGAIWELLAASMQPSMTSEGRIYSVNICSALARMLSQPPCKAAAKVDSE